MKKLILISVLLFLGFMAQSQILVLTLAAQGKGVDSVSTPHGLKATNPITQYEIVGIVAGMKANVTNTDSAYFYLEVSLDNTNWIPWDGVYPVGFVASGGTKKVTYGPASVGTYWAIRAATVGQYVYGLYKPTSTSPNAWPYVRLKTVGTATARCYITAYLLLKHL